MRTRCAACGLISLVLLAGCGASRPRQAVVDGKNIRIEFDQAMHSRVTARLAGKQVPLGDFSPSEFVATSTGDVSAFTLQKESRRQVSDEIGTGQRYVFSGTAQSLAKNVSVTVYDAFPAMAVFEVEYVNNGSADVSIKSWTNNAYSIAAGPAAGQPAFWSYQSGSYSSRPDWVLPLKPGFRQANFLGMNATDYGGGTPVVDVWRRDAGIAVGHLERVPKEVELPVAMPDAGRAALAVTYKKDVQLKPGASLRTFRTFVAVHQGDHFAALSAYRQIMGRMGRVMHKSPGDAFEPIWCAWGYGRDFTFGQVFGALPVVKKIGFKWVTLDDGWQTSEGDWFLNPKKFPHGDRDMKAFVDKIHAAGFKAQLWWAPLAADPGTHVLEKHPEWLLLNADGSKRKISWWDSWYLCPADKGVIDYHTALVTKIIRDWGFDGLKLDGQHMNGVPPCYNSAHRHASADASVESVPAFFKAIYDTARSMKPDALVEFCPCGTAYSAFTLPYVNMTVGSDPASSWQVRLKGKTLKALQGDDVAYFGDHVELSDGGDDFASSIGIGGVVGTNFTWPPGSHPDKKLALTPPKEAEWNKWVGIYKSKMLSRGEYLGTLYDIGFDRPETHAIRKDGVMYYAFYAPKYQGQVELRGLADRAYKVVDYVNGRELGRVRGPLARMKVTFDRSLLVEVRPD